MTNGFAIERSASAREWKIREPDDNQILAITQRYGVAEPIARLLVLRDVPLEEVGVYLEPKLRELMPDPATLQDMDKAVARLAAAVEAGEPLAIFGDYDVDGATSSAVLFKYLSALGQPPRVYIPDRQTEGYGPNAAAFETLQSEGHRLIVTVDCGTMSHDVLAASAAAGVDVIVIDHHQSGGGLPSCAALVNPRRGDDDSGLDYLAAVGVAFFVAVGLHRELRARGFFDSRPEISEPDLMSLLDLVALGTVCDVVPLRGVNRAFVKQGLQVLQNGGNDGIVTLAQMAKSTPPFGTYEMGFQIGPRLNAGGRVGKSDMGVRLLTSDDAEERVGLAARLDDYNKQRRDIEAEVLSDAIDEVETNISGKNIVPPFILVADDDWHIGVIGIVASRLKDRYNRPAFVLGGGGDGTLKGSARSTSGIDVGRLVAGAVDKGLIEAGGGHAMAAGVTLKPNQRAGFEKYLHAALADQVNDKPRSLHLDAALTPKAATREFYDAMQSLGPFGAGNPEPCFSFPNVRIINAAPVGNSERGVHVRCVVAAAARGGGSIKAIAFASVSENVRHALLTNPSGVHIAGALRADDWQGRRGVQLHIYDLATS